MAAVIASRLLRLANLGTPTGFKGTSFRRPVGLLTLHSVALLSLACAGEPDATPAADPAPATPEPTAKSAIVAESTAAAPHLTPSNTPSPASTPQEWLYTPTGPPPKVDKTIAGVDLDNVVFDTFRGGFIPLSVATDSAIEGLRDVLQPIYEPVYVAAGRGEWLRDEDLVVGYASQSGAYAYPIKMLNYHEIVNDVIDGVPVLVSYCPLCASGVVYSRDLDGRVLLFGNTSALYESDMVMYDHETGSYWFQVLGEAIVGPLTGKRLEMLPATNVTWGEWKRLHPETQILSRRQRIRGPAPPYERDPFVGYGAQVSLEQFAFPVSPEKLDDRLPSGARAFAVQVGETHKAYHLSRDSDWLLNDTLGGKGIVVLARKKGPAAFAYYRASGGRELSFKLADGAVQDTETESTWDDAGRAVSGPLAGTRLSPVPSRTSFWFSLVGALPGIELHQLD